MTTLEEVRASGIKNLQESAKIVELAMQQIQIDYTKAEDCSEQFAMVRSLMGALVVVDSLLNGDIEVGGGK